MLGNREGFKTEDGGGVLVSKSEADVAFLEVIDRTEAQPGEGCAKSGLPLRR